MVQISEQTTANISLLSLRSVLLKVTHLFSFCFAVLLASQACLLRCQVHGLSPDLISMFFKPFTCLPLGCLLFFSCLQYGATGSHRYRSGSSQVYKRHTFAAYKSTAKIRRQDSHLLKVMYRKITTLFSQQIS